MKKTSLYARVSSQHQAEKDLIHKFYLRRDYDKTRIG